jgi:hypothetical protein
MSLAFYCVIAFLLLSGVLPCHLLAASFGASFGKGRIRSWKQISGYETLTSQSINIAIQFTSCISSCSHRHAVYPKDVASEQR